jgi:hypothetical protein
VKLDVSVIIVNWNTKELLRNCIESVYQEAGDIQYEVIVVDNASSDSSAEMVTANFGQVTLIRNGQNRGFAAANNQGMAIAKGRYVLLLNSDTVVLDGAIAKTVSFADNNPEAAVVGCRVLNADRTLQPTCFMFPSLLNLILSGTYLYKLWPGSRFWGRERMSWWDRKDVREVDVVTGCFMLVRREAIEQIGLMDERFFVYGEETDWCYRFKRAGWKVVFAPVGEIIHFGAGSSRRDRTKMRLQLSGSILLFLRKHKGWPTYAAGCFLTAVFFALRIPYWLVRAVIYKNQRMSSWRTVCTYATGFCAALVGCRALCIRK